MQGVETGTHAGVPFHLDHDQGEGHLLVRDSVNYDDLLAANRYVVGQGFEEAGTSDDAYEPYTFPDGEDGIKVWLSRKAA